MSIWLTARGAGLSALTLLTITICAGALAGHFRSGPRVVLQYVHRASAALGIGVLALHVGTILADSYAHVGVIGAIVPFTSSFRATWIGLGTIAAYLFLFVSALGLARGRMAASERGAARWRALHMSSYLAWAIAVLHGFFSGTDSSTGWVKILYLACVVSVAASVTARLSITPSPVRQPALPTPTKELVSR
jgi:DMSO/TMAO reductase YedYZ heme-binding membrane subunit